jgi:hypothetical protein
MTSPDDPRHVEVKDGDQPVAAAEVTTSGQAGGTVRASLHPVPGSVTPGSRASLVDAVMDLPEVQASEHLEATVPLGDAESLRRLQEKTGETVTRARRSHRAAGCDPAGGRPRRLTARRMPSGKWSRDGPAWLPRGAGGLAPGCRG